MRRTPTGDLGRVAAELLAQRQGVASWVWVRPILMMWSNGLGLGLQRRLQVLQGRHQLACATCSAAAMCMAVG